MTRDGQTCRWHWTAALVQVTEYNELDRYVRAAKAEHCSVCGELFVSIETATQRMLRGIVDAHLRRLGAEPEPALLTWMAETYAAERADESRVDVALLDELYAAYRDAAG